MAEQVVNPTSLCRSSSRLILRWIDTSTPTPFVADMKWSATSARAMAMLALAAENSWEVACSPSTPP